MVMNGQAILKRQQQMEQRRQGFEAHWREIARYVHPNSAPWNSNETQSAGGKRLTDAFDSTPMLANDRFAAAMESMLVPRTQRWHSLTPDDRKLARNPEVRRYLDEVNEVLFSARYAPRSGFPEAIHETFLQEGAFGTGALFVNDDLGRGIRYQALPLGEVWADYDAAGRLSAVHRKFKLTVRQVMQAYREPGDQIPERVSSKAETQPDMEVTILHCVRQNDEIRPERADWQGMAWVAYDVLADSAALPEDTLRTRGYRTMPYMIPAYTRLAGEWYGRSPAMMCLADIKSLNTFKHLLLKGASRAVDPVFAASEAAFLTPGSLQPGVINPGWLGPDGTPLIRPIYQVGDLGITKDVLDDLRSTINATFLVTLFQILVDTPQITATEAIYRQEEKGQLLAPAAGRQYSELFGPMIERELDILDMAGQLPDMPPVLQDAGGSYAIRYDSPIMHMQRAAQGSAILQLFNSVTPLAQVDPTVLDRLDFAEAVTVLADAAGVPERVLRSDAALQAMQDERATQAQATASLQGATVAADVAQKLGAANAAEARARF